MPLVGPLARARLVALARRSGASEATVGAALSFESTLDELSFVLGPALVGLAAVLAHPAYAMAAAAALVAICGTAFALHPTSHATTPIGEDPARPATLAPGPSRSAPPEPPAHARVRPAVPSDAPAGARGEAVSADTPSSVPAEAVPADGAARADVEPRPAEGSTPARTERGATHALTRARGESGAADPSVRERVESGPAEPPVHARVEALAPDAPPLAPATPGPPRKRPPHPPMPSGVPGLFAALALQGAVFGACQAGITALTGRLGQADQAGLVYAAMGVMSAVAGLAMAAVPERVGARTRRRLATGAALALSLPLLGTRGLPGLYAVVTVLGVAYAPHLITVFGLLERAVAPYRLAETMGVATSALVGGQALAVAVTGRLAETHGPTAAFAVASAAAGLTFVLALTVRPAAYAGAPENALHARVPDTPPAARDRRGG